MGIHLHYGQTGEEVGPPAIELRPSVCLARLYTPTTRGWQICLHHSYSRSYVRTYVWLASKLIILFLALNVHAHWHTTGGNLKLSRELLKDFWLDSLFAKSNMPKLRSTKIEICCRRVYFTSVQQYRMRCFLVIVEFCDIGPFSAFLPSYYSQHTVQWSKWASQSLAPV